LIKVVKLNQYYQTVCYLEGVAKAEFNRLFMLVLLGCMLMSEKSRGNS